MTLAVGSSALLSSAPTHCRSVSFDSTGPPVRAVLERGFGNKTISDEELDRLLIFYEIDLRDCRPSY